MENFSDIELIENYLQGQELALTELINRYFRQVFYFAKTYVKQDSEAEDVTQEVFVKLWKNIKKYDKEKKFKTWLFQITKNTCIDFLRKNKMLIPSENMEQEQMDVALERIEDTAKLPQDLLDSELFVKNFEEILSTLPPPQAETLILHLQQELTFQEISESLNEPLNTVKSRYRRGLEAVKNHLLENAPKSYKNRIINN